MVSCAGHVRLGVMADTGVLGGPGGIDRFSAALTDALLDL
jgi:hypothetical protein